jgi:hypothetical protein
MRFICVLFALGVSIQAQSGSTPAIASTLECPAYASKLDSCSPYTCTFTHPMTGAKLERTIIGLTGEKCETREAMPGKLKLQCEYPPDVRRAVAGFFRDTQAAEAAGKTVGGKVSTDENGKAESTTTVDGKPVQNPLQHALEAGVCKIVR